METRDAIFGRRAVREYGDRPIPEETISEILEAGAMAPSAMGKEPCRFIVITKKEKIRELSDKVKSAAGAFWLAGRFAETMKLKEDVIFYGAPLLVFLVAEKTDWSENDCALAAQNMMLRAYDLGLGSCFIGFARMLEKDRETLRGIGMMDNQVLYCPLVFGYAKKFPHHDIRVPKIQKEIR